MRPAELFADMRPDRIPLTVIDLPRRRRRRKRRRDRQTTMALPPRLVAAEQGIVLENYRLAFSYVQRQGWRFETVIDRDDQISECFLKLCSVLDQSRGSAFDIKKAKLSTFAWRVFYRHLSGLASRSGRLVPLQMSALVDFDAAAPEVEVELWEGDE